MFSDGVCVYEWLFGLWLVVKLVEEGVVFHSDNEKSPNNYSLAHTLHAAESFLRR
jgi:hypothetical protein